ncbi:hypothetical protein SLEP1_g54529 [Rubroshorea leprosula]|uniref:Uncharacterized protein n=1 Tax=Rubroshorea leprosula TaxID=152421 RepID=A0AAV5MF56_9ROSI|nr:hypothetical protein SLEP1_g54529 [Rubroshorea leprosula]
MSSPSLHPPLSKTTAPLSSSSATLSSRRRNPRFTFSTSTPSLTSVL